MERFEGLFMRHLGPCLALLVVLCACGPRPAPTPEFPPATSGGSPPASPTGAPPPPVPEATAAVSPEAEKAARAALEDLWKGPGRTFYDTWLLEARRKDTPFDSFEAAIEQNLVEPHRPLKGIKPISRGMFEVAEGFLTMSVSPSEATGLQELESYGDRLQETYWQLDTGGGEVLAALLMVPDDAGQMKVQSVFLRSQELGTAIETEDPQFREKILQILALVRKGDGKALYGLTSPGLQRRLALPRFEQATAEFRQDLGDGGKEPKFLRGRRWYSEEGWTRTYEYDLGGFMLNVNLLEKGYALQGLTWVPEEGSAPGEM